MKTLFKLFTLMTTFGLIGASAHANRESGGRLGATTGVYFNFGSFGTGIDCESYELALDLIESAKARGEIVGEVSQPWGREGEVLLCVEAGSVFLPHELVKAMTPSILKDRSQTPRDRTSVRIGADCSDYDNATEQDLQAYVK